MARRTKEDALTTRAALLDAAMRVFGRRGVARSTLAEIAQEAGLTRGAVYWHFKDKADIFNAMMDRVTLPLEGDLQGLANVQGDPVVHLIEHVRRALHQIETDLQTQRALEIATLMIEHVDELGSVRERYIESHRHMLAVIVRTFEQAATLRRQALPAPAPTLAAGYHALVRGMVFAWLLNRGFPLEQTTLKAVEVYLAGAGLTPQCALEHLAAADQG